MDKENTAQASRTAGSQILARGLMILRQVTESPDGLSITEVSTVSGIHRTVAYRILNTLCDARMLHRGADGRYRGAAGLLPLAAAGHQHLRTVSLPLLQQAASHLGATVALLVREANSAVALAVVAPRSGTYHVAFTEGSQHPLDRGAAGLALLAAEAPTAMEPAEVAQTRQRGFAQTFGQVEPNMHGLAVPLMLGDGEPTACLNVITLGAEQAAENVLYLQRTATLVAEALAT